MADKDWRDTLSALATLLSTVIIAAVGLVINSYYNQQQIKHSDDELSFEKLKYDEAKESEKKKFVSEVVPKILSKNPDDKNTAKALLFVNYPNEAQDILKNVSNSVGEEERKALAPDIKQAEQLNEAVGRWGIVVGHDTSLSAAAPEVARVQALNLSAVIYKKGNFFVTVANGPVSQDQQTGFQNQDDAQGANIIIRSKIRPGTYVVNLKSYCVNPVAKTDGQISYFECANR